MNEDFSNEDRRRLQDVSSGVRLLLDRQNSHFTDIMIQLRRIEDLIDAMGEMDSYSGSDDELYEDAKDLVIATQKASTSFLQRRFGIGYSRAARLIDLLEEEGVIGEANGSAPRGVLVEKEGTQLDIEGASG